MVQHHHLQLDSITGLRLAPVRIKPRPLLIDTVVRIVPRKQRSQLSPASLQILEHAVDLRIGEVERGRDMLVHQPIGFGALDVVQTVFITVLRLDQIPVQYAIVVDAAGGEGIADKENALAAVFLHEKSVVIQRLAGKVRVSELEFVPPPRRALGGDMDIPNRIRREAWHLISHGPFQDVLHLRTREHRSIQFLGCGLNEVGVIVMIVRNPDSLDGQFELFHFIEQMAISAIHQERFARTGDDYARVPDHSNP